jgi:hypothetical protein
VPLEQHHTGMILLSEKAQSPLFLKYGKGSVEQYSGTG